MYKYEAKLYKRQTRRWKQYQMNECAMLSFSLLFHIKDSLFNRYLLEWPDDEKHKTVLVPKYHKSINISNA